MFWASRGRSGEDADSSSGSFAETVIARYAFETGTDPDTGTVGGTERWVSPTGRDPT
jgi:hypothetical protein